MEAPHHKDSTPLSSYEFQLGSLSIQDALIILAIRLVGGSIRRNPSAQQHIVALARAMPLFTMEDYEQTQGRINRFINWAGTDSMDDLYAKALEKVKGAYRDDALQWSAANAVTQQLTDERGAVLHHIGKALGFTASEVEASLVQARRHPREERQNTDAPDGAPAGGDD